MRTALLTIGLSLAAMAAAGAAQLGPATPAAIPVAIPGAIPGASPAATPGTAPGSSTPSVAMPAGAPVATPSSTSPAAAPSAQPQESNPFSDVRPPADTTALKQALPDLEQRLRQVEGRVSAIQQVQVALPADALGGAGGVHSPGTAPGVMDEETMELQAATFIACVNGKAMFRDSDQKPFFVDSKKASQNDAVRRVGGCKP